MKAKDKPRKPAGTSEGGQFAPVGGLGSPAMSAFRSMPQVDSATSKEAAKWHKDNQALYDSDPEFKAACDAIGLYTQGSFNPIRDAAHVHATGEAPLGRKIRDGDLDQPLGAASSALATYKNHFDGQDVANSKACKISESGGLMHGLIAGSAPTNVPLYRGIRATYRADLETGKSKLDFDLPEPGSDFDLASTSSFSSSKEMADGFALYRGTKRDAKNAPRNTEVPVLFEVSPGAKAANVSALSPWKGQREFITAGRFKVDSVEETSWEIYEKGATRKVKGYHIKLTQTAVINKTVSVTPQARRLEKVSKLRPEPEWVRKAFDEVHSEDQSRAVDSSRKAMSVLTDFNRGWLIEPDALRTIIEKGDALGSGLLLDQLKAPERNILAVDNGVATITIEGPILRKPDIFARVFFGATSSEAIADALREAEGRDDIKVVFLNIDSPGGTVAGTPELAHAVAQLDKKKPVYAFSSGLMCSAAYWIASQARAVYVTPSAQVGSIGVVQTVIDNSAALENRGIKVDVFSVGKYKAMGAPGTPLTDDQRALISSNLMEIAGDFHAAVLARGRAIPAEAMEGQTFSGKQAQRHNLAGMVADHAEALRRLRVYHASVDTASRAMTTALEDQLLEARTQVDDLTRDYKAQADLLNEASAIEDSLRGEVALLTAEIDTLKAERDAAKGEATALQTRIADLQASQADFDKRVQTEVARVVASTGTTLPARVTPAGDATPSAELHAQFAAITDPAAQTAFWRKLTPEQQALILKHQA